MMRASNKKQAISNKELIMRAVASTHTTYYILPTTATEGSL